MSESVATLRVVLASPMPEEHCLLIEKLEQIVHTQVEAIKNLKIDKITVWDSGGGAGGAGSSTANFASSLIKSLPPLHEVARMAGIELPEFLGEAKGPDAPGKPVAKPAAPPPLPPTAAPATAATT